MPKSVLYTFFSLLLLVASPASSDQTEEKTPKITLNFGVVPQQNPTALAKVWTPVLNYLSQRTGYQLLLQTSKDIPSFNQRLRTGDFDIAYMNPLLYATNKFHGYDVFAKEKDTFLKGIVVVAKNSPYDSLESLRGATLAFPDQDAFAATLLPITHLQKAGVPVTPFYVMSHDSVYRAVAKGLYPAGGGVIRTLEQADAAVRDQLRILWTSPPFMSHPIAAQSRVPEKIIQKLLNAMVGMHLDPQGMALLKGIGFKGIEPATDNQYDTLRALTVTSGGNQ